MTNTNIFGSHYVDEYKYEYFWVFQKWGNMNINMIIRTNIPEYEYEYYRTQNKTNRYVYGHKRYKSKQIYAHMGGFTQGGK